MDPFYAFLIFIVLLVLEHLASQNWVKPYFRIGIPVYFRRTSLHDESDPLELARVLEDTFRASPAHPSVMFRPVALNELALREALFENRAGFRYLPVMHGLLRLNPGKNSASLIGFINFYVLAALVYGIYRSLDDRTFIPVAIIIAVILGLSYLAQVSIFRRILAEVPEPPDSPPDFNLES